jgi:hypothetical protein
MHGAPHRSQRWIADKIGEHAAPRAEARIETNSNGSIQRP